MKYLLHSEETARLSFREIRRTDFAAWQEFFKDPTSFQYWTEQHQSPEIECEKWYSKQFDRYENDLGGMNALIEKASGTLIGHCGLLVQQVDGKPELEIAYSLLRPFRNNGYATEAAMHCRDFAFRNNLAQSLISIISISNTPSATVAARAGLRIDFETIYKGNAVHIFRIHRSEWRQFCQC